MKQEMLMELDRRELRYKESDWWFNDVIGKEMVRFDWKNPQYKGHFKTIKGIKYFDDYIMEELQYLAEKNSGGFKL